MLLIIVTEVLQGLRSDRGFHEAQWALTALPRPRPSQESHVRAAELYRSLRSEDVTIRGAVDCVIAPTCIDFRATLLSPDRNLLRPPNLRLDLWAPAST